MTGFHSSMIAVVRAMRQHSNDFFDVAKSTVFKGSENDADASTKSLSAWSGGVFLRADSSSPGTWYDGVKKEMEGALTSAESALEARWLASREPSRNTPVAQEEFVGAFEANTKQLVDAVAKISQGVEAGTIRKTPAVTRRLQQLQGDVSALVSVYEREGYYDNLPEVRRFLGGSGYGFGDR